MSTAPALPDFSRMTEDEQIAYALQMSMQGGGLSLLFTNSYSSFFQLVFFPFDFLLQQQMFVCTEFGGSEAMDVDTGAAADSEAPKVCFPALYF